MPRMIHSPTRGAMKVPVDIYTDDRLPLDEKAVTQLCDGAAIPGVVRAVGTPDIHCGYGVPIGCVLGTSNTVVPAAAGYDINCGMQMLLTNIPASSDEAAQMARQVRKVIPLGEGKTNLALREADFRLILGGGLAALGDVRLERYPFHDSLTDALPVGDVAALTEWNGSLRTTGSTVSPRAIDRGVRQLGTLGGGNHFIEFQQVTDVLRPDTAERWGIEAGQLVIMIHSGSRGFGHEVASRYLKGGRMMVLDSASPEGRNGSSRRAPQVRGCIGLYGSPQMASGGPLSDAGRYFPQYGLLGRGPVCPPERGNAGAGTIGPGSADRTTGADTRVHGDSKLRAGGQ